MHASGAAAAQSCQQHLCNARAPNSTLPTPAAGEYPVASTAANERAENTKHLQNRRGETVVCVFSGQGAWRRSGSRGRRWRVGAEPALGRLACRQ